VIFDPVRRRKISDYGGHERIFLIHSAYAENLSKTREIVREAARKMDLTEEDVNFWVAPLIKGIVSPKHILIDLHEGLMAVAEFLATEFGEEENRELVDVESVESFPYVCLLPGWEKALKGRSTVYLDFSPDRFGFGVVSFVGPPGVYSVSLASSEMPREVRELFDRALFPVSPETLRNAKCVAIKSEESYSFSPCRFILYTDLKKQTFVSRAFAFVSVLLLVASFLFASESLSTLKKKANLEREVAQLDRTVQVLERRAEKLPSFVRDPRLKQVLISAVRRESVLEKLPPHVKILNKPSPELRVFLRKYQGAKYVLLSSPSPEIWLAIKKTFPQAQLLPGGTVLISFP